MKKHTFLVKLISLLLCAAFITQTALAVPSRIPAVARNDTLAPSSYDKKPVFKREMYRALLNKKILVADKDEDVRFLDANRADCILVSSGKYLVRKDLACDDLKLLRAIIHEDVESYLQILLKQDRSRYQGIRELLLPDKLVREKYAALCPGGTIPDIPNEFILNDMVAKAFELIYLLEEGMVGPEEIPFREQQYLDAVYPILKANKATYFASDFWDPWERGGRVEHALSRGFGFVRAAMAEEDVAPEKKLAVKPVPADTPGKMRRYFELKKEMLEAADKNDAELFRARYREMQALIGPLREAVKGTNEDDFKKYTAQIFADGAIPPFLLPGQQTQEGLAVGFVHLREELEMVGQKELDPELRKLVSTIVDEVVEELYPEGAKREQMRRKLNEDILSYHFNNIIPEAVLTDDFSLWKDYAMAHIAQMSAMTMSLGMLNPHIHKISLKQSNDELQVRVVLKHEIIHYLADAGEIRIPAEWENITFAVSMMELLTHCGKPLADAEQSVDSYKDLIGDPLAKEIYLRGKEMGRAGEMGFIVRPGVSDRKAGYFSTDLLIGEVRAIYQKNNQNADHVVFDPYNAQRVAGIMMAGILMGMKEKDENIKPLALLRDFFAALHERYAEPTEEELGFITKPGGLLDELQRYASSLAGKRVTMEQAAQGLWDFIDVTERTSNLLYVITDLYPRPYDGKDANDIAGKQAAARERGLGQLVLAVSKILYGKRDLQEKFAELKERPEFAALWDTLLTPRTIYGGLSRNRDKVQGRTIDQEYKGALGWILRVFKDRYDIGNPMVEETLLRSLPLHLQYVDSLLYRFSHFDGRELTIQDPRLKSARVRQAVAATFGGVAKGETAGWGKLMMLPDDEMDDDAIVEAVKNILTEYQKLFEEAVRQEELRRAYQRMIKEDIMKKEREYEQLLEEEMRQVQEFWDSLPEEAKEAIRQAAQKQMEQAMEDYGRRQKGQPQPGQQGQPQAGQQGMPQPGQQGMPMPGQGMPQPGAGQGQPAAGGQAGLQNIEQHLAELENVVNQLQKDVEGMTKDIGNIKEGANQAGDGSGKMKEKGADRKSAAGKIADNAKKVQDQVQELQEKGRGFDQGVRGGRSQAANIQQGMPSPEEGDAMRDGFDKMGGKSAELNERLRKLQEKANHLAGAAERLKKTLSKEEIDETHVSAQSGDIGETAGKMKEDLNGIKGANRSLEDLLKKVERDVGRAARSIQQAAKGKEERQGEKGKGQEGQTGPEGKEGAQGEQQPATPGEQAPSGAGTTTAPATPAPQLPQGMNLAGLNRIADRIGEDLPDLQIKNEPEPEAPLFDDAWLNALQQQEELDVSRMTGLTPEEYKEYQGWKAPYEQLIAQMTEALQGLIIPSVGMELETHRDKGSVLKHLVQGALGEAPFAIRKEKEPMPVKITLLIDTSGSMGGDRIRYACMTALVLLEVISNLNEKLESKGFNPIEFEVGMFSDDDTVQISHETSRDTGTRKERVIYDILKKITAGGGTDDVTALGRSVTRLTESPDRTAEKSRRILFVLTDGNLGAGARDDIKQINVGAEEKGAAVFAVAVGDEESREQVKLTYGDRTIVPKSFAELPKDVMESFVEYLAPPSRGRSWQEIMQNAGLYGLVGLAAKFALFPAPFLLMTAEQKPPERKLEPMKGYKNFYTETVDGRSFLVFKKEGCPELKWERGAGGKECPETVVPDILANEDVLLSIIQSLYRRDQRFTSYSPDGRYLIRYDTGDTIEITEKVDGKWKTVAKFPKFGSKVTQEAEAAGTAYVNDQGLRWMSAAVSVPATSQTFHELSFSKDKTGYKQVVGWQGADPAGVSFVEESPERIVGFDPMTLTSYVIELKAGAWTLTASVQMEREDAENMWEGTVVELVGESGVGKGELIRAAAHLMNEELFVMAGNEDMEVEDLTEHRTLGVKEAGVSDYQPSTLAKVQHYGGWCLVDEIHKVPQKVLNAMKASIAAKTHEWRVADERGGKRLVPLPNHPRARILATSNVRAKGFHSAGQASDQAMQRRKTVIKVDWLPPQQEIEMQYQYAIDEAKRTGKYPADPAAARAYEKKIKNTIMVLVKTAVRERLVYLGYNGEKQAFIYKNWSLLQDPSFVPDSPRGEFLRREPSPRVIKSILKHFVNYPSDFENRQWDIIQEYYNFKAEDDKRNSFANVKNDFEAVGIGNGPQAADPMTLNDRSFVVKGDILQIVPLDADGKPSSSYDVVELKVHPDAEILRGIIPEEVKRWVKDPVNARKFYTALQGLSLGRHLIFVGEQETGKSTMATALAKLLSGPQVEQKQIEYTTSTQDVTFSPHLGEEGKAFQSGFKANCVPRAMDTKGKGKVLIWEETPQGRPGMIAVLNEIAERGYLLDPDGKPVRAQEGFAIIHAINPPGSRDFQATEFSKEFLERHMIIEFAPLPPDASSGFVAEAAKKGTQQVNPKLIGEPMLDAAGNPVYIDGVLKWRGILGLEQEIRRRRAQDPQFLPRAPGLGTLKKFVRRIIDDYEFDKSYGKKKPQEVLWDIFVQTFTMEADEKKVALWQKNLREAFVGAGLWTDAKGQDAIDMLLVGEDVIIQRLGVVRAPATGIEEIDRTLTYIQENTLGASIAVKLEELFAAVVGMYDKDNWGNLSPERKLEQVYALKEIYQVLKAVRAARCDPKKGPAHEKQNIDRLDKIIDNIQTALVVNGNWPDEVLDNAENKENFLARHILSIATVDPVCDEILLKVEAFAANGDYVIEQLKLLQSHIVKKGLLSTIDKAAPEKSLYGLRVFLRVKEAVAALEPLINDEKAAVVRSAIASALDAYAAENGMPPAAAAVADFEMDALLRKLSQEPVLTDTVSNAFLDVFKERAGGLGEYARTAVVDNLIVAALKRPAGEQGWEKLIAEARKLIEWKGEGIEYLIARLAAVRAEIVTEETRSAELQEKASVSPMPVAVDFKAVLGDEYDACRKSLIARLDDKDEYFRQAAIEGLVALKVPAEEIKGKLIAWLDAKDMYGKALKASIEGLIALRVPADEEIKEKLIVRLDDKYGNVRQAAIKGLIALKVPAEEIKEKLIALLGDKHEDVRQAAIEGLIGLKVPAEEIKGKLIALLDDKYGNVRQAAIKGLIGLKVPAEEFKEKLIAWLDDKDWSFLQTAIEGLIGLKVPAEEIREKIIARLDDEAGSVRIVAIEGLIGLKVPADEIREKLIALLDDEDGGVRRAAIEGLIALKVPPDEEIKGKLVALFDDEYWNVRQAAIKGLIGLKVPAEEIKGKLIALLDDKYGNVRQAAIKGLIGLKVPA
ncbi:MAG TPA: HEAT repeat domain-containing protein, partial [bacterium]|nr:HEAT repeat domain-containing protein [bacterium]